MAGFDFVTMAWQVLALSGATPGLPPAPAAAPPAAPPALAGAARPPASRGLAPVSPPTPEGAGGENRVSMALPPPLPAPASRPAAAGGWRIHLESLSRQDSVEPSEAGWRRRLPQLFRGLEFATESVEVPGKGTFLRLYAGPFVSAAAAEAACAQIHRQHLYCRVSDGA